MAVCHDKHANSVTLATSKSRSSSKLYEVCPGYNVFLYHVCPFDYVRIVADPEVAGLASRRPPMRGAEGVVGRGPTKGFTPLGRGAGPYRGRARERRLFLSFLWGPFRVRLTSRSRVRVRVVVSYVRGRVLQGTREGRGRW